MFIGALFTITKTCKVSVDGCTKKENAIDTDTPTHTKEYYTALKKGENPAICMNINEPGGHYVNRNKSNTERQILALFLLFEVSKMVKFIELKSRMVIAQGWEERIRGKLLIYRHDISIKQMNMF